MHISSPRNIPLLEHEHGSARVQHADPLRPAPGCRDESCARGYARAQGESLPAADSAGRHFRRPQFARLTKDHWKFLGYIRKLSNPKRNIEIVWVEGNHDHGLTNIMSHLVGVRVYQDYTWEYGGLRHIAIHGHQFDGFQVNRVRLSQFGTSLYLQLQKLDLKGNPIARLIDRLEHALVADVAESRVGCAELCAESRRQSNFLRAHASSHPRRTGRHPLLQFGRVGRFAAHLPDHRRTGGTNP